MIKEITMINKKDGYAIAEGTTDEIINDLQNMFGEME